MALTEKTRPYETLIRHNPDGSIGAHHQTITEILRDKVVIQGSLNDPIPLNVADGKDGLNLSKVLGEALAEVINDNGKLSSQLGEMSSQLEVLVGQLGETRARAENLDAIIADNANQVSAKDEVISDLRSQIELLKIQVAALAEPMPEAK